MTSRVSRREFLAGMGALTIAGTGASGHGKSLTDAAKSPFRVSVINDEIGQDFGHVCEVARRNLGCSGLNCAGCGTRTF